MDYVVHSRPLLSIEVLRPCVYMAAVQLVCHLTTSSTNRTPTTTADKEIIAYFDSYGIRITMLWSLFMLLFLLGDVANDGNRIGISNCTDRDLARHESLTCTFSAIFSLDADVIPSCRASQKDTLSAL